MNPMQKISLLLIAAALTGCSLAPAHQTPVVAAPANWSKAPPPDAAVIARDWWKNFGSAELNKLMEEALARNYDLRAAVQRVEQSRAALKIAGGSLVPAIDASAGASRVREQDDSSRNSWRAGAGISYELDLFGANRADVDAAQAGLAGSRFSHDALALVVMGDVARNYFNVLSTRERLKIADDNLKNAHEVLNVVEARYEAGVSSALEVAQQKASLFTTEATRATLAEQATRAENALAVLLSRAPQTVAFDRENIEALTVPRIRTGQPSDLALRRPDIREAEMDLVAANADIGAARAAFFPTVTLGADLAFAGNPFSNTVSLTSALLAPIFRGGELTGGVEQAQARQAELVEIYRKTILTAFQETEDALAAEKAARERQAALTTARAEAQTAYDFSNALYKAGTIDFQTLLDAQRALLQASDTLAQSRNDRLAAAVDLFKALGGGWKE